LLLNAVGQHANDILVAEVNEQHGEFVSDIWTQDLPKEGDAQHPVFENPFWQCQP
jgi:hypothetical protein